MSTNQVVQFNNQTIPVFFKENKPYVAMKPICENIGLQWEAQYKKIQRNHILKQAMSMMDMPSKGGIQQTVALPIGYLNGWLMGIDVNKVKPEIKQTLIKYQLECYDVLYNHFMPKVAEAHPNTITLEQQQAIKDAVLRKAQRDKRTYQSVYRDFYNAFDIPRYQELPLAKFEEAVRWLGDGWYANKKRNPNFESHAHNTALHMLWVSRWWYCYRDAIRLLNPKMAGEIHDHFMDGSFSAGLTLGADRSKELDERIQRDYPYQLGQHDLIDFFRQR